MVRGRAIQLWLLCQQAIESPPRCLFKSAGREKRKAPMSQISEPNLKENRIVELLKERGAPFPHRNRRAERKER
jgi:hypothetical protein